MSSTSATSASVSAAGSYSAAAMIPITRTFVQASATTAYTLVGQVLDNGQTNWVGYDSGSAYYIATASAPGEQQTSLADGHTYYVSSGSAPPGVLAGVTFSSGSQASSATGSGSSAISSAALTTTSSTAPSSSSTSSSGSSTGSASASASATSQHSSGCRLSINAVVGLFAGLLAVVGLNVVV